MNKQAQSAEKSTTKRVQPVQASGPVETAEAASLAELTCSLLAAAAGDPLESQSGFLGERRHPRAQRQDVARKIGSAHGNRHLQRVVGLAQRNGRALQRQDEVEKRVMKGVDPGMLKVEVTKEISVSGAMSAEKKGEGAAAIVAIHAPKISFIANVDMPSDVELSEQGEGFMKVGPVQTMTSSTRVGVYKKGEKEVARYTNQMNDPVRDSKRFKYAGEGGEGFPAEQPFYDKPGPLTNDIRSATVSFEDEPTMSLPLEFGGGRLTRVEGADRFNTSIGIKRSGVIKLVKPFGWQLDWSTDLSENLDIQEDEEAARQHITSWEEATGIVMDTETYAWKEAAKKPPIFTFYTVDAAMTESASTLWLALAAARNLDPGSVSNIEEALRRKDPNFKIKLTVSRSANRGFFGGASSDTIGIFAVASKQSKVNGPYTIEEGASVTVGFKLSEIIDPSSIDSASKLKIWAGGHGDEAILGDFAELGYPFLSSASISVTNADGGGGTYKVDVSMA